MKFLISLNKLKLVSFSNPSPELTPLTCSEAAQGNKPTNNSQKNPIGSISTSLISQTGPSGGWAALQCQHKGRGWAGTRLSTTAVSWVPRSFCSGSASHLENTQAVTQICPWGRWFLRRCYVFSCAFVKTLLRNKVFSLEKANCFGTNSHDDFHNIKVFRISIQD